MTREWQIDAAVLIPGEAEAEALVLGDTLSFWGGFDPVEGKIVDVHHPQSGVRVGDSILCIPQSKGSAGTPGGIAETLRRGSGPRAFLLGERDVNISVGTLVANRLYDLTVPVVQLTRAQLAELQSGDRIRIDRDGRITVYRET